MWLSKAHTSQEAPTSTSGSSSLYKVSRDDLIGKKILNVNEKYYIVDHGIREAILESNQRDINQIFKKNNYTEQWIFYKATIY